MQGVGRVGKYTVSKLRGELGESRKGQNIGKKNGRPSELRNGIKNVREEDTVEVRGSPILSVVTTNTNMNTCQTR